MRRLVTSLAAAAILAVAAPAADAYLDLGVTRGGDCRLARDPRRCAARLEARAACRDKRAAEKRRCIEALLPAPDCGRAPEPARCQALAAARAACQGKSGAEFRRCMQTRLPGWRGYQAG